MLQSVLRLLNARSLLVILLTLSFFAPAHAASVPTDAEQEILVKATLMTFNDANLTGNYSILHEKSAKPFRAQFTAQKLADIFKTYRDQNINMEHIVAAEMDAGNKATIDGDGVLNLKGRFKEDNKRVRFDMKFINENGIWKMIGINVNYKEE